MAEETTTSGDGDGTPVATATHTTIPATSTNTNTTTGFMTIDPDVLGDAGKKALDAERAERRKAEKRAKELDAELAKLREASMSEQEKAVEAARREAREEALRSVNQRLIAAEVRAAAGGRLADPEDAVRFLDLDQFPVSDDGEIDRKAIADALDGLVKQKPYLAAGATRPAGDADQGARGAAMALNGDPLLDSLKAKLGIQ